MSFDRPLLCLFGIHRPGTAIAWNEGYYFARCERCGHDIVRTPLRPWHIPRGRRVVWQSAPPASHPRALLETGSRGGLSDPLLEDILARLRERGIVGTEAQPQGHLRIEGQVDGDLACESLLLEQNGRVRGSIRAHRVQIAGMVEGDVDAVHLSIAETAYVAGDVSYVRLRVASGGVIDGAMRRKELQAEDLKLVVGDREG
ncbi:MAG: polymer-forming cytoskeletal protein [Sphingomonadaceae bacterium]